MDKKEFEGLLDIACRRLTTECRQGAQYSESRDFEARVRAVLTDLLAPRGIPIDLDPHPHVFPDIVLGQYGVEVKFTTKNSWRSVANSVFETTRSESVKHIYLLYGKMGGEPEVAWGRYEDCVIHVRTSHVPRFEVEIQPTRENLFTTMGVSYDVFAGLSIKKRMELIRKYARSRLKKGEHLWWLEEEHSLPLQVRLYTQLPQQEKRKLRAEAALLCPQIVKPSQIRDKYNNATMYLLTYHGVLCPQARDLFSAGSVALRADKTRGGRYIERALKDIEQEMQEAADTLEDTLFIEYWEYWEPPWPPPRTHRIREWLRRADTYAKDWKPSDVLFRAPRRC